MMAVLKNERISLKLFFDEFSLPRPKTKMNNVNDIIFERVNLIYLEMVVILRKSSIENIHEDVRYSGIASTLTKLHSKVCLVRKFNYVKTVIDACIICKFIREKFILTSTKPPLLKYRVCCSEYLIENVGID